MRRDALVVKREGNPVRHRVILTDDPALQTRATAYRFLQELVNGVATGLLTCGPEAFHTLKIEYDGISWIAVMEAEER